MINQPQDVSSWFENVMHSAIEKRASDVHLEPEREAIEEVSRVLGKQIG